MTNGNDFFCIIGHFESPVRGTILCNVNYWWLVRVTLVVAFDFLPQNFGRWGNLRVVLSHSMNAGSVVRVPTMRW